MSYKVLFVGDPHLKITNIPEVEMFIDRLYKLAMETAPDLIILGGDILDTHERVHTTPLNKAYELFEKLHTLCKVVALVGNHDMCFGMNVPVQMNTGKLKMSQNIKIGDVLIGDDNTPRTVLSTTRGVGRMFMVLQKHGMSYTVNENHILTLRYSHILGYNPYEEFQRDTDNDYLIIEMTVAKYMSYSDNMKERFFGIINSNSGYKLTEIQVVELQDDDYFGWTVDGNQRFLLEDGTVVHNCNNQIFLTPDHWMNGLKEWEDVTIVDKLIKIESPFGHKFVLAPYVFPGRFQEALNTLEGFDWKRATTIFAHQEIQGCKMGAIVSVEGDKWPLDYPDIVSGHIHSNQTPQKNVYYPGSSMQHAFGESEKNVVALLTYTEGSDKYVLKEVELGLPRKKIVYTDINKVEDYKVPEDTKDKIKLSVSGNIEEFKAFKKTAKYKELVAKNVKVVFKPTRVDELGEQSKDEHCSCESSFMSILHGIIHKEKNKDLENAYNFVIKT